MRPNPIPQGDAENLLEYILALLSDKAPEIHLLFHLKILLHLKFFSLEKKKTRPFYQNQESSLSSVIKKKM